MMGGTRIPISPSVSLSNLFSSIDHSVRRSVSAPTPSARRSFAMQDGVRTVVLLWCCWLVQLTATLAQEMKLEQLLSKDEQSKLAVSTMSPDKKAAMRDALVRTY